MEYQFTKDCETGIAMIDKEHQQFFAYINEGMKDLAAGTEDSKKLAENVLKKLAEYAIFHFEHEENYMKEHNDAELFLQIRAHQGFRDKINEFTAKEEHSEESLKEIFGFMAKWLYSHIISTDTLIGKVQSHDRKIEMTKDFLTGIEIVDTEHAKLFEIIGRVYEIIEDEYMFDKYDPIMHILGELKDYTVKHFSDEEEYMESISYTGLPAQKLAHDAFIEKLGEVDATDESSIDHNQTEYLHDIADFLTEWLINHILKMDTKIPAK